MIKQQWLSQNVDDIKAARDELMIIAAKYNLSGFFYISQTNNAAATHGFFQEHIAGKMNEMENILVDLSWSVVWAAKLLIKALLRFTTTAKTFAKPGRERAAIQHESDFWWEVLTEWADGLKVDMVLGIGKPDTLNTIDPDNNPRTEEDLERLMKDGKLEHIEKASSDKFIQNRIRQICNAISGNYYGAPEREPEPVDDGDDTTEDDKS